MMTTLPVVRSVLTSKDFLNGARAAADGSAIESFRCYLADYLKAKYVYLTNSGLSSFYIILEALKGLSEKREVVLPAYTASSLMIAVKRAGLKSILCDVSMEDFNADTGSLLKAVSRNTLAVVCIHMFGIGMKDIAAIRQALPPDTFLVEDCAQSMGTSIGGSKIGSLGDVSFFSFGRGKNIPACGGGAITTNNTRMSSAIEKSLNELCGAPPKTGISGPLNIVFFALATNPFIYRHGYFIMSRFKSCMPSTDFPVRKIGAFEAGIGLALSKRSEELFAERNRNGMLLINSLKGTGNIILPKIPDNMRAVFNRMPVVFRNNDTRKTAEKKLWEIGINGSWIYTKPLHHLFDVGYRKEDFPNANRCANGLLTLPVHPRARREDLSKIAGVLKKI